MMRLSEIVREKKVCLKVLAALVQEISLAANKQSVPNNQHLGKKHGRNQHVNECMPRQGLIRSRKTGMVQW